MRKRATAGYAESSASERASLVMVFDRLVKLRPEGICYYLACLVFYMAQDILFLPIIPIFFQIIYYKILI